MEYNYRKTRARHRTGYRNRRINRKKELIIKVSGTILTFVLVTGAVVSYFGKKQEDILVQAGDSMVKQVNEEMEITIPEGTTKEETEQTEQEIPEKKKFEYPAVSESYADIVSEEIKSPYIALLDVENNQIIAGRNIDAKIYPASMTKVLSLIVAVENITDLSQTFTMTGDIIDPLVREEASRAGFEAGDIVSVEDMLYGLVLPSGADAAVGLAIITAGSEAAFADLMNQKCAELGLVSCLMKISIQRLWRWLLF